MSDWDFIDEVDILPKLPPNFDELRESKKWQERKEALEILLKLVTDNERLSTKVSYAELIGNLQTILAKDANINCQALAAKCIGKFATGLRTKFAPFATPLLPVIFDKMKEKKPTLREPLVECSNEVGRTMASLETSQEDIIAAFSKPNPQIKQQTVLFVARQLDILAPAKQPKALIKAIVPIIGKLTGDADSDVREAAIVALGAISRLIGEKNVKSLLGDASSDDAKMKKVAEAAEKSAATFAEEQAKNAPPAPAAPTTASSSKASASPASRGASSTQNTASAEPQEADPWDFLDAFDVIEKMPDGFDTNIESKKWQERKEALEGLLSLMTANPKLEPKANYGSLVEKLQKVLAKDANINVAALAANCLTGLANGLRTKFSQFATSVAPTIFDKFKEKKPTLRDPLIVCIDAVLTTTNLEVLAEIVLEALAKPNPSIKTQTDLFLQRSFMKLNSQTMPKKSLKSFVPLLIKHSGDSDSEVRDASYAAMGAMMRAIGEKPSLSLLADIVTDNLKMTKIKEYHQKALEEAGPAEIAAMVQSIHKSDAPIASSTPKAKPGPPKKIVEEPVEEESEEVEEEPLKLPAGGPKKEEKKKPSPRENAENEPPAPPKQELLLAENNEKAQRISDERKLKLVKWNFQSPTDEHISQLQTLLSAQAKVSLMSQLFHKDFKQHLSALDSLIKLADVAPNAIIANSDLLLKWCTLRFFETNPAALIKVLEFSRVVVTLIQETETQMSQEEVSSFVPYLLLKTGEPKENMRTAVRNIIDTLSYIVGPLKLTPMLIDGLKSKNARQRTECLLVIESYINTAGVIPLKSLNIEKTVAVFVGDKDVNVRNAAINVLVACFKFEGDQMWKQAGRMADKDKSLVEERIKRSGVKPGSGVASDIGGGPKPGGPKIVVPQQGGTVVRPRSRTREPENGYDDAKNSTFVREVEEQHVPRSTSRYALREDDISGAFSRLANNSILQPVVAPLSSKWTAHQPIKRTNSSSSISSIDTSDQIQRSINNISSSLSDVAQDALYQVTYVLNQPEQRHLVDRQADLVFRACAAQFDIMLEEFNSERDITGKMEACTQMLFILLGGVDQDSNLEPLVASIETVKSIIISVLRCIIGIGNTDAGYSMARNLNRLAMRLIYRVELSNLLCGLVSAMTESFRRYNTVTTLLSKLASKWCDELEKRRTQMRASDIVENFNSFYICTLVEQKLNIDNEYVLMMDNTLERVIIQQGEYLMDAARRLSTPHMHLTSLINKVLQQMRERGIQPILPGTLEDLKVSPNEDETLIIRSEASVLVDNIIRDTSYASKYIEQLKALIASNSKMEVDYLEYTKKHILGEMIRELVDSYQPNYGSRLSTAGFSPLSILKTASLMGEFEEPKQAPPVMNFETPSRREAVPAQTIRRNKRTTMSREQLASIKMQLDRVKQQ